MPNIPKSFTVAEAAKELRVSDRTIRNLIDRGRFPNAYRLDPGSRSVYRIPVADVEAFQVQQQRSQEPQ